MGSVEDGKDPTSSSFEKTDWFVIDGKFKMNQQYVPWLLQKKKKSMRNSVASIET